MPMIRAMSKSSARNEPTGYPEYGVRKEDICAFFSPPMPSSTFHDRVNKGIIVPIKGMRGFYKLNDSLRRLGLREVPALPQKITPRTTEEIIRFVFHTIDPEVFPPPSWVMAEDAVDGRDGDHATLLIERHADAVAALGTLGEKHAFMQGLLDIDYLAQRDWSV
jgi:hypothetical protein